MSYIMLTSTLPSSPSVSICHDLRERSVPMLYKIPLPTTRYMAWRKRGEGEKKREGRGERERQRDREREHSTYNENSTCRYIVSKHTKYQRK